VTGEWVDIPTGDGTMGAYLAPPPGPGPHPAVLVGFEMFGLTGYVRGVADRIAGLGYTTLVPDFYHRLGDRIELTADPAGRERGLELLRGVHRDGAAQDARAALACLRERGDGGRAAMVRLSVGGHLAYYAATATTCSPPRSGRRSRTGCGRPACDTSSWCTPTPRTASSATSGTRTGRPPPPTRGSG
jgi:carboxymethylenebutenolidase